MGNNAGAVIQILLIVLFLGGSAISWLAGRLRDQMERKRLHDEAQRRRAEEIRTGRPAPGGPEAPKPAEARLQELAARRQAQLRELRRQQLERTAQSGDEAASGPRRPGRAARGPGDRRTVQPRPPQRPETRGGRLRPISEAEEAGDGALPRGAGRPASEARRGTLAERLAAQAAASVLRAPAGMPGGVGAGGGERTARGVRRLILSDRSNLRALIAAAEVLRPPAASRDERESPWSR